MKRHRERSGSRWILALLLLGGIGGCATPPPPQPPAEQERAAAEASAPAPAPMPAALQATYRRALEAMREESWQEALELLLEVARSEGGRAAVQVNLGIVYLQSGRQPLAGKAFSRALELEPGNPVALNQLALMEREAGRFGEAERLWLRALEAHPDYANAHLNLGILYDLYLQRPVEALEHYRAYQQLGANSDEQVTKWIVELERRIRKEENS